MEPQNIDLAKSLVFNAFFGLGYYTVCSRYSLLTKEVLDSQVALFTFSAIVYNPLQSVWGSEKTLNGTDIIPIAMILLFKVQKTSWKIHGVCTVILAGTQIVVSKVFFSAPKTGQDTQWISNMDILHYSNHIRPNSQDTFIALPYPNIPFDAYIDQLNTHILQNKAEHPDAKALFFPLHVKGNAKDKRGNHWTLIYINFDKRVVEYYDSKMRYGTYDAITQKLEALTVILNEQYPDAETPFQFESKITKRIQPDAYQCGVWVLYFIEKLLENPNVDFNALDIDAAQKMIADYRRAIIPHLEEGHWN